jgi:hypothetical protein
MLTCAGSIIDNADPVWSSENMAIPVLAWGGRRGTDGELIAALAAGATQAEAARQAGVSERTVRRRLLEPSFAAALAQARRETVRALTAELEAQALRAIETLCQLMHSTQPPQVRLGAARTLLDQVVRYHNAVDFEDRLAELEALISHPDGARL